MRDNKKAGFDEIRPFVTDNPRDPEDIFGKEVHFRSVNLKGDPIKNLERMAEIERELEGENKIENEEELRAEWHELRAENLRIRADEKEKKVDFNGEMI